MRKLGLHPPMPPEDQELYYIQIKAARYCKFYTRKGCNLPLEVRPRQCTEMRIEERGEYKDEKMAFYLEYVKLIEQTGSLSRH